MRTDPYKVAQRVLPMVLLHSAWATLIVGIRLLPISSIPKPWSVSPLLHTLLCGVLGLLLAFRTNQAWSRYWSAAQAWCDVHRSCQNFARLAAQLAPLDPRSYSAVMRHLIALPISLKHRARGVTPDPAEYFWPILAPGEADAVVRSPLPHLVLLSSLSLLISPIKARDDGSGKGLAVWGQLEGRLAELQAAAAALDLAKLMPPPASYTTHTARFILLWLATLPLVLIDKMAPLATPPTILAVGWALYSTEELAKLLDQPFGRVSGRGAASQARTPEAVPVEALCERIVSELQYQVAITRMLQRRVEGWRWAVTPIDLEVTTFKRPQAYSAQSTASTPQGDASAVGAHGAPFASRGASDAHIAIEDASDSARGLESVSGSDEGPRRDEASAESE